MLVSRKEAKCLGLSRYFSGLPCASGHISERYVISAVCIQCARERQPMPPIIKQVSGENWKDIPGYEGFYAVSNLGRVKSLPRLVQHACANINIKERLLTLNVEPKRKTPYLYVFLSRDGRPKRFRVHSLVLLAFVGRPPRKELVCRHLDSNPQNNNLINLCWGTPKENMADEYAAGHSPVRNGKFTKNDILRIRGLRGLMKQRQIAANYGVSVTTIANIHQRKTWKHVS